MSTPNGDQDSRQSSSGAAESCGARSKEEWMQEDWVVAQIDSGPEYAASTKRECIEYASGCCLREVKNMDTTRWDTGVYTTTPQDFESHPGPDGHVPTQPEYWVFRPEAMQERGAGMYMLDPEHYT